MAYRKDRASAITATARKLATIMYHMVIEKKEYQPMVKAEIPERSKNKMIKRIQVSLSKLCLSDEQLQQLFLSNSLSVN